MAPVTPRSRQIADVLVRHGLSALADRIGLREHLPERLRRPRSDGAVPPLDGPARLREALEELGPTFVKLGQMLSTRDDLLPVEYTRELARLQDGAAPVDSGRIAAVIEEELGAAPAELYADFSAVPLATASIGQAHRARLHDGTDVIVKVRKPGVSDEVLADLDLMHSLASFATREWELARDVDVEALVATFDQVMRGELDYRSEARNAERFRRDFADDPRIRIPAVFDDLTTSEVLTEELMIGHGVADTAALDAAGIDRPALADSATQILVQMVLVNGFFHADPHPGNLFVEDDGTFALIDFGMVGQLSPQVRESLLRLLFAISRGDQDAATTAVLDLAPARGSVDRRQLRRDMAVLVERLTRDSLAEVPIAEIVERLTGLLRRHRLQLPPDVSTLLRMLVLTESTAVVLDPAFRLGTVIDEVMPVALLELLSPSAIARRVGEDSLRTLRFGAALPQRLERILDDYEARGVDARLHAEDLDRVVERFEGTADRLIVGMTLSSLLVAAGSVLASERRTVTRDPLLLVAGGGIAVLGSLLAAGSGPSRKVMRAVRRGIRRG